MTKPVETQPGSPHFDGAEAYEQALKEGNRGATMKLIRKDFITEEILDTADLPEEGSLRDVCIELAGGGWTPRQVHLAETYRLALLTGRPIYIAGAPNEHAVIYDIVTSP